MSLLLQYGIIVSVWILSLLLILIIPRQKRRLAMIAFLFKQYITCFFGHAVVELQLLAYPVRELADVSRTSFTYEYMAYPMTCAVFNAYYPSHRSGWIQFGYYVLFATVLTIVEVLLVQYTDLIRYVRWNWFWSWATIFLTFLMTRAFCVIYFGTMTRVETSKQKNAQPVRHVPICGAMPRRRRPVCAGRAPAAATRGAEECRHLNNQPVIIGNKRKRESP